MAVAAVVIASSPLAGPRAVADGAAPEATRLRVLEFNIEYGGMHVSTDKTLEVIRRADADIVAIEEAQGHTARLARALGYPYVSLRLQLLSRFPIIDPPGGDGIYVFVEVAPGAVVAFENVHLPSNPYGPFRVKQGYARADVVDLERGRRLPTIRPSLRAARALLDQGIPVFLAGDFNSPSWRDWTPEMVGVRYQIRYPIRWPVSLAVERAGFVDSYRKVHPDPRRDPGLTWWAARPDVPGWDPGAQAPQDRIDFVYAAGAVEATASSVIGERGSEISDLTVQPWPSDHRATVSTFTVTPGETPVLVALAHQLVTVGSDLLTTYHASGTGGSVALVPAGGDPATGTVSGQPTGASLDGTLAFATDLLEPGSYEAVLLDAGGGEVSRIPFWLEAPGAGPVVSTGKDTYDVGEPIDVRWSNARGERWDWIGIYRRDRDPHVAWYLLWLYTGARVEGQAVLDARSNGRFPLAAGRYSVYLLRDDGYVLMASSDFTIAE